MGDGGRSHLQHLELFDLAECIEEEELRLPIVVEVRLHIHGEERADGDVEAKAGEGGAPI